MRQAVLANTAALISGLYALSPALAPLSAQAAPAASSCSIDQDKPKELALAYLSFTRLGGMPAGPGRDPLIKSALKDLMDKPEKFTSNPGGYNYVLSQILAMAATQPDGLAIKPRSAWGLTTRPTEPLDVVTELDATLKKFEAAAPGCGDQVVATRNGDVWMAITNKALSFGDAGPADSAVYWANRSMLLAPKSPYGHYILANTAQRAGDDAKALPEWKEVAALAAADTTFKQLRTQSLFYLGLGELKNAIKVTGEAQKTGARAAAGYFKDYIAVDPMSPDAPNVMTNWATALGLVNDTAGTKAIYADMAANPTKYSEMALLTAGVIASVNADDAEGAVKLFQGVVAVNPYSREGLSNLASALYGAKKYTEVAPIAKRLTDLDPNNYDGWMFHAYAANEIEKTTKAGSPEKKAWGDSIQKYSTAAENLKVRVGLAGFQRSADGAEVTLSFENQTATAGTYSVSMDFLDKAGAVVSTVTESVGPVTKGEKKTMVFKGKGANIVGYRYKPIP